MRNPKVADNLPVIFILIVVGILFLVAIISQNQRRRSTWRIMVRRMDMKRQMIGWNWEKHKGTYRERPFVLEVRAGRPQAKTRITLSVNNHSHRALSLAEDSFYREGESFGAEVFKSGDEAFDHRFTFKTHSEIFARYLLSLAGLRHKFLHWTYAKIRKQSQMAAIYAISS